MKNGNNSNNPSQRPSVPTERKIIAPGTFAKDSAPIPAFEMAPPPAPKPKPEK